MLTKVSLMIRILCEYHLKSLSGGGFRKGRCSHPQPWLLDLFREKNIFSVILNIKYNKKVTDVKQKN